MILRMCPSIDLRNNGSIKIGIPSIIFSLGLIFSLSVILSYNDVAHAQQIISLQAFQQSDNSPIPDGSIIQPTDVRFDYTADQSVNFRCILSIVNEDLSGAITRLELSDVDCGTGSTQGSNLYPEEVFQSNGNNAYEFTVFAIGGSPIVNNRTFTFQVIGGSAESTPGQLGGQASTIVVDKFWGKCSGVGLTSIDYEIKGIANIHKFKFNSNPFIMTLTSNLIDKSLRGEFESGNEDTDFKVKTVHTTCNLGLAPVPGGTEIEAAGEKPPTNLVVETIEQWNPPLITCTPFAGFLTSSITQVTNSLKFRFSDGTLNALKQADNSNDVKLILHVPLSVNNPTGKLFIGNDKFVFTTDGEPSGTCLASDKIS